MASGTAAFWVCTEEQPAKAASTSEAKRVRRGMVCGVWGGAFGIVFLEVSQARLILGRPDRHGTKIGRVIDGFIDYTTSVSVFLGLGIAMTKITGDPLYSWLLTVAAGISKALQNMLFDNYRNLYLELVYGKASDIDAEIEEYTEEWERLNREGGSFTDKMLVKSYIGYSRIQKKLTKHMTLKATPESYKHSNKLILRLWSWIGSTTHMVALIICTVLNRIDIYLILTVTAGNLIMIFLKLWQDRILKEFKPVN